MDKSKVLLIILGYPSGSIKEKAHLECIESFSSIGIDSMLVSKAPAKEEIQKKFKYFVYSSDQEMLPRDLTPNYYMVTGGFKVYIANQKHTTSILSSTKIGILSAKTFGYDFAIFVNYDNLFSEGDAEKLLSIAEETIKENKKGFFFTGGMDFYFDQRGNPEGAGSEFLNWYESAIFGMDVEFFEKNFNIPTKTEDFIKLQENGNFSSTIYFMCETIFYNYFSSHSEQFKLIEQKTDSYFSESTIDRIRSGMPSFGIVKNIKNPESPIAFFSCELRNAEGKSYLPKFGKKKFIVRKEGEIYTENILNQDFGVIQF